MKVAIIGYSQSGKSTLYRAASRGLAKGDLTAVPVPDPRFEAIVKQVNPKKATPATVMLEDGMEPISGTGRAFSPKLLDSARKAELLLHVVRGFENPMTAYHAEVDPFRDIENVNVEIVLADLQVIETRLEKLKKSLNVKSPGSTDYLENALFQRLKPMLEDGHPIRDQELTEDEVGLLRNYQFLSTKPIVCAINVNEGELGKSEDTLAKRCAELNERGLTAFLVCASAEEEISQLDSVDQPEFLASLGLDAPASERLIRAVYDALGLITFFTAGENDTHAWPLRRGSSALKAAATIHNDIAKGFIRAEIVHFSDYLACGSLDSAYSAGKMSLEGKEYVIQDGDLLHIRNKS